VNALWRDDAAALAEDPMVARTRTALARNAETRAEERGKCAMTPLLVVGVDVGAERLLRVTVSSAGACALAM
jgi:hypothetical protein